MNWASLKLAVPVGALGGLIAISAYIGVRGDEFTIFDLSQLSKILNLFIGQFIVTMVAFLVGLNKEAPHGHWNGIERRNHERRENEVIFPRDTNKLT